MMVVKRPRSRRDDGGPGLILHAHGAADVDLRGALQVARNAIADLEPVPVEIVVQGAAVLGLLDERGGASLVDAAPDGVQLLACANSLAGQQRGPGALAEGVGAVAAAVGHLARRQWAGWAYVRL